jgi:hypothetical protein
VTISTFANPRVTLAAPPRPFLRRKPDLNFMRTAEIARRLKISSESVLDLARREMLPAPMRKGRAFLFDRQAARLAIAAILQKRAQARRRGLPDKRPPPFCAAIGACREPPLSSFAVARILGLSVETVRDKTRRGEILGAWKTKGELFFEPLEIRRLRYERSHAREAPHEAAG